MVAVDIEFSRIGPVDLVAILECRMNMPPIFLVLFSCYHVLYDMSEFSDLLEDSFLSQVTTLGIGYEELLAVDSEFRLFFRFI